MITRLSEYIFFRFVLFAYVLFISALMIQSQFDFSFVVRKISWIAWLIEPAILTLLMYVIYRISVRPAFSKVIVTMFYLCLLFLNEQKIAALEIPLVPADFIYAKQLFYLSFSAAHFFIAGGVLLLFITALVGAYKLNKPVPMPSKSRWQTAVIAMVLIVLVVVCQKQISWWMNATQNKINRPNLLVESESLGVMTFLLKKYLVKQTIPQPRNYSEATIRRLISKYQVSKESNSTRGIEQPNVIIFLIEAFTDPLDNKYALSADPIPNFRLLSESHHSGNVLSPVVGGRSANVEFELLTGLSMRFIPRGSIPFIDLLDKPILSIADIFRRFGYQTHALHVASLSFFNYNKAYPNLGFDQVHTLEDQHPISYDSAGRYPSESSLVDEIINLTKATRPQFIHAFPNSTHGPYDYQSVAEIALLNQTDSPDAKQDKVTTYINALHEADKAIGKLIQYFESTNEKTMILVLGDHMPGLMPYRLKKTATDFLAKYPGNKALNYPAIGLKKLAIKEKIEAFKQKDPVQYHLSNHYTPYLLWTNFASGHDLSGDISMNLLHLKLLEVLHTEEPLYQITKAIHHKYGVFSTVIREKNYMVFNAPVNELQSDYEVIQYDLLYGYNYYGQIVKELNLK